MTGKIRFRGRDILLDTNLLVILVVGYTYPLLLQKARFSDYSILDFELLHSIVTSCRQCVTTPHIIAEASNILKKAGGHADDCRATLGRILGSWEERYFTSEALLAGLDKQIAIRLGVADGSTLQVAKKGTIILTADAPLAAWLNGSGHTVYEYSVLRELQDKLIRA